MNKGTFAAAMLAATVIATPALADGGLSFIIDGDTYSQPFTITNTSTAGEYVVGFGLDLTGTGLGFDTVDGGPPAPNIGNSPGAFFPLSGTDSATGLNGPVVVPDGSHSFALTFTDFGAGESFIWSLDVDPFTDSTDGSVISVYGNMMIGAHAYVDFSNGLRAIGVLAAVDGNPDAAAFTVTSVVETPPDGAVPEPATWAMMLGGFGAIGAAMRRKRTAVSFG